jgi:hypothetical protein
VVSDSENGRRSFWQHRERHGLGADRTCRITDVEYEHGRVVAKVRGSNCVARAGRARDDIAVAFPSKRNRRGAAVIAGDRVAGEPTVARVFARWAAIVGAIGVTVSKALPLTTFPAALPTRTDIWLAL